MNTQQTTGRPVAQATALVFAVIVSLATLVGIDRLAATRTSGQMLAHTQVTEAKG